MNTPTRLAEASGTSGEKALMNGVLNFSVLDGWWYEGYRKEAGWAITDKATYQDEQYQNQLDAETIYFLLERKRLSGNLGQVHQELGCANSSPLHDEKTAG